MRHLAEASKKLHVFEPDAVWEERIKLLKPYQVNADKDHASELLARELRADLLIMRPKPMPFT